jgi:hypothetical protein
MYEMITTDIDAWKESILRNNSEKFLFCFFDEIQKDNCSLVMENNRAKRKKRIQRKTKQLEKMVEVLSINNESQKEQRQKEHQSGKEEKEEKEEKENQEFISPPRIKRLRPLTWAETWTKTTKLWSQTIRKQIILRNVPITKYERRVHKRFGETGIVGPFKSARCLDNLLDEIQKKSDNSSSK